jgi:hypothetical protein
VNVNDVVSESKHAETPSTKMRQYQKRKKMQSEYAKSRIVVATTGLLCMLLRIILKSGIEIRMQVTIQDIENMLINSIFHKNFLYQVTVQLKWLIPL